MNYSSLISHCEKQSALSRVVIDNFLMNYAAEKEKLPQVIFQQLKKYKHVVTEFEEEHVNRWNAEFIVHHVFKKGGAIRKLLNHSEVKRLPLEHYNYLVEQSLQPWRFTFSQVVSHPKDGFFKMQDVMTYEEYVIYSPGIQQMIQEGKQPQLWFLLIGFNGKCWQSFGLNIPFRSYTVDDLFFFATELNPRIGDEETLMLEVEKNPFPFFMLLCKADIPVIVSRGYEMVTCNSIDELPSYPAEKLWEKFDKSWNKDVFQLKSKAAGEFPHYAVAYINEKTEELMCTSMTEFGYVTLAEELNDAGIDIEFYPQVRVTAGMFSACEKIFNRKIELNPYEKLFEKRRDPKSEENLGNLNKLIELILPLYNAGKKIDVAKLAKDAGVDEETAKDLWEKVKKQWDTATKKK